MKCGQIHNQIQSVVPSIGNVSGNYIRTKLYTAYLGRVSVDVLQRSADEVYVECLGGRSKDIVIRVVDAVRGRVDYRSRPSLRKLSGMPPSMISIKKNKETFYLIQQHELNKARMRGDTAGIAYHQKHLDTFHNNEPEIYNYMYAKYPTVTYNAELLRSLYVYNSAIDILFQTSMFLVFLNETMGRDSINKSKLLLSLYNIPDLDNAFFSGEYMLYGNGEKYFYPLCSIDIASHELTHGLVHDTAGLEYIGHSGALNESMSDVMATGFEFWIYDKFNNDADETNDLHGEADWLLGEDVGKTIEYLRNLRDPTKASNPQPKLYKGVNWVNPNNESMDYGGVHINSGISNHCYYLLSEKIGQMNALKIFYNCLLKMSRNSDFIDFRNIIIECTPRQLQVHAIECLNKVGLTKHAVSDWNKSPQKNKVPHVPRVPQPPQQPQPPQRQPQKRYNYPNEHIPYIRGLCCPHCACLQPHDTGSSYAKIKKNKRIRLN